MKTEIEKFTVTTVITSFFISLIFYILILKMLPLSFTYKALLCIPVMCLVFFLSILIIYYSRYIISVSTPIASIMISLVVILSSPVFKTIYCSNNKAVYMKSCPDNGMITVQISIKDYRINSIGRVGSEWISLHYLNSQPVSDGSIIEVNANDKFAIISKYTELDDSFDDIGVGTTKENSFLPIIDSSKSLTFEQIIRVAENRGKGDESSFVDWKVTYTIKRIIPTSMQFRDFFFYSHGNSNNAQRTMLIIWQITCLVLIIIIVFVGRKKKQISIENERIEKERIFQAERNAFIDSLQGKNLRQTAGVPDNISFVNGYPKDNNDSEFGSFTVYCSINGKCYHDRKGCCSARIAVNYLSVAQGTYKPCSKCCQKQRHVPEWFIKYNELKSKAKHYNVEYKE